MRRVAVIVFAAMAFAVYGGQIAQAHKVIASVFSSGSAIEGEVGFSNGDMAADTLVEVFDGNGNRLGETRTDADGFFSYTPTSRVVHVFKANLGAGHVAEVRMGPEDLPGIAAAAEAGEEASTTPVQRADDRGDAEAADVSALSAALLAENRELVREMIHKEVTPLRREIAAYKEKNDLQSILGGMGYIAGLFGVFFYVAARRKLSGR